MTFKQRILNKLGLTKIHNWDEDYRRGYQGDGADTPHSPYEYKDGWCCQMHADGKDYTHDIFGKPLR